jgi:hypothetical protein
MRASTSNGSSDPPLQYRWIYVRANLQVQQNLKDAQALAARAKAAGYNGIVLDDYKLQVLDRVPSRYFVNLAALKHSASELGLKIFPVVCPIGYSNGLLSHDPNLAEGVPVREAPFIVKNREARLMADAPVPLKGDQIVRVETFRQYHVSIAIRMGLTIRAAVLTTSGRVLVRTEASAGRQSWTTIHMVFNSLDNKRVRFLIDGSDIGKWKNANLEEVGLLNVLRRAGTPLTVQSEDGRSYEEGRDFRRVEDDRLGVVPYPGEYEVYHRPAAIRLTSRSRIEEGQRLRISFYHCVAAHDGQMVCCLTEPKVYSLLEDQIRRVQALLEPAGFFLGHDEIRVANWCDACSKRGLTPGRLLADNLRRCLEMTRRVNPKAELFVWSDMFDPAHNARDQYHLVNGSWVGSWEALPKEVTVVNWNLNHRKKSLKWFAERGHRQVIAGFYDRSPRENRFWMKDSSKAPNLMGAMYTTWTDNYECLESFARRVW